MLKDGIVLEDSDGRIVVNQYSFCELVKYILVHYAGITYAGASEIVDNSHLANPIKSVMDAGLLYYITPEFTVLHWLNVYSWRYVVRLLGNFNC